MKFDEILKSEKPVLIDFFAEWCGPCKMLAPILKEVKEEVGDAATIVKIDVDKSPQAAQKFEIRGVPTLILYKGGKQVWRQSGLLDKKSLLSLIKQYS
jgi:thioredoxin 1